MKGNCVKTLHVGRLLVIVAFGWSSLALGDAGRRPADLSVYVFLHLTRGASVPFPSAGREYMCRGKARMLRT